MSLGIQLEVTDMLRPRDFVGIDYVVQIMTEVGQLVRLVTAFDREDALAQMMEYCRAEDLEPLSISVL